MKLDAAKFIICHTTIRDVGNCACDSDAGQPDYRHDQYWRMQTAAAQDAGQLPVVVGRNGRAEGHNRHGRRPSDGVG